MNIHCKRCGAEFTSTGVRSRADIENMIERLVEEESQARKSEKEWVSIALFAQIRALRWANGEDDILGDYVKGASK